MEESKQFYQSLVEFCPHGIGLHAGGKVIFINSTGAKLLGAADPQELIGKSILDFVHPDYHEIVLGAGDRIQHPLEKPQTPLFEATFVCVDGTSVDVEMAKTGTTYQSKPASQIIFSDITRRKEVEAALRESERKFRDLAENSLVGIYLIQNEVFTYANPHLAGIFGYTVDEFVGKKGPVDLVLPEDWPTVKENIARRLSGKIRVVHYDFRARKKNGEVIYIEVYGSRTVYLGLPAVIGTLLDTTDRRNAGERIRSQNKFLQKTIESLTHPFYVINANDYTIAMANAAAGLLPQPGRNTCYALTHGREQPCDSSEHPCPLELVRKTGKATTVEHIHRDKNGAPRNIEIHGYPVLDDAGNVIKLIEYSIDITERKQFEKERETLITQLQDALTKVKTLRGMLPICASCKKIRDDKGYWKQIEGYIRDHSEAEFSHGICPDCVKELYPEFYDKIFGEENE